MTGQSEHAPPRSRWAPPTLGPTPPRCDRRAPLAVPNARAERRQALEDKPRPVDEKLMAPRPFPTVPGRPDLGDFAWAPRLRAERRERSAPTVGALIHTRNEERNVADAIRSVGW